MTTLTSDFLRETQARGFVYQCTHLEALDKRLKQGPLVAYLGFDATAEGLHVGSLVMIMWLRWLQKTGHKPLVLMGGGTTQLGDPSDKDEMRKLLSLEVIFHNIEKISESFKRCLHFSSEKNGAVLVNNNDWLSRLDYISFLREYGKHFTINRMLTFDSVRSRLEREQPLTFLEFNYMILQAYDYLHLYREYGCELQMGGKDQWGNILNGTELVRRLHNKEVFGITAPLLTTSGGGKMGKTARGAIWLRPQMLSTLDFWQFWRNTQDADVGKFLRLFTELPLPEIERLEKLQGAEMNEAKKILANEVTLLLHGEEALSQARRTAETLYEHKGEGDLVLPTLELSAQVLSSGIAVLDLFCQLELVSSKSEARRLIRGGGARLNDLPLSDENQLVTLSHQTKAGIIKLSAGKKKHALVKVL